MIAIINRLPVKEGAAGEVVERFANSRGNVQGFPGFVSMEVLSSEAGAQGIPPTGKEVAFTSMEFNRVVGGKVEEHWVGLTGSD